jgi:hypothetical protein
MQDRLADVAAATRFLLGMLDEVLPDPPVASIDYFDYPDAVRWFAKTQPPKPGVNGGALIREHNARGWLVVQVFLTTDATRQTLEIAQDDNGQVYGRKFFAGQLGEELTEAFDGKDLLIFH